MTSSDAGRVAPLADVACPRCSQPLDGSGERRTCRGCGKPATVLVFEPPVDEMSAGSATGRCAQHPNKDAAVGCGRCGSFICDVCATRTGEQVLCPACFDTLHERGDLATTRTSRVRWDQLTLACGLVSWLCYVSVITAPAALALGVFALSKRRKEPWLSTARIVWGMVLALIGLAMGVALIVALATRKK